MVLWGFLMLLAQVDEHRDTVSGIASLAQADIGSFAASIVNESPERVAAQLRAAAPAVVSTYGGAAAVAGALFYETNRPRPGFTAPLAEPSIGDALMGELGWALAPLFATAVDDAAVSLMLSRLDGVTQKFVSDPDRETLRLAAAADPTSRGIRRYATAGACAFCAYLSSVQAHVVESSEWHLHCNCVNVPGWDDNPAPVNPHEERWAKAAEDARSELVRLQHELKPANMRWRNFYKANPDLTVTTKNILRLMRADLGLSH